MTEHEPQHGSAHLSFQYSGSWGRGIAYLKPTWVSHQDSASKIFLKKKSEDGASIDLHRCFLRVLSMTHQVLFSLSKVEVNSPSFKSGCQTHRLQKQRVERSQLESLGDSGNSSLSFHCLPGFPARTPLRQGGFLGRGPSPWLPELTASPSLPHLPYVPCWGIYSASPASVPPGKARRNQPSTFS